MEESDVYNLEQSLAQMRANLETTNEILVDIAKSLRVLSKRGEQKYQSKKAASEED